MVSLAASRDILQSFVALLGSSDLDACPACRNPVSGCNSRRYGKLCSECSLFVTNEFPTYEIPRVLSTLTLVEQLLITQRFSAAYRITLICNTPSLPVKYNVDLQIIDGPNNDGLRCCELPLRGPYLEKLVTLNVVGTFHPMETALPDCLRVRRGKVHEALKWLILNNPVYSGLVVCDQHLQALPADGFPPHISRELSVFAEIYTPATPRYLDYSDVAFEQRHISEMFPCLFPFATSPFTSSSEEELRRAAIRCFEIDSRFRNDMAFTFVLFKYILSDRYNNVFAGNCLPHIGYELGPIVQAAIDVVDGLTGIDFLKSNLRGEVRGCIALLGPPDAWLSLRRLNGTKNTLEVVRSDDLEIRDFTDRFLVDLCGRDTTPVDAATGFEEMCQSLLSGMVGSDTSERSPKAACLLGDITAFISNVSTEPPGNLVLNMLIWLSDNTQQPVHDGGQNATVRRAVGERYDLHVMSPVSPDPTAISFMTKSIRPPHVFTNRTSQLMTVYNVPSNETVQQIVDRCASSVMFGGALSPVEMTRVILNYENTHCSHTFVNLNWDALVGTVKSHFHLEGPGRLTAGNMSQLAAYKSRDSEWDDLSLWQFMLRRFPSSNRNTSTIPRLTGRWTPIRIQDRPLYWASMLALWKPWRMLDDLRHPELGFHDTFDAFLTTTHDNLQVEWGRFQIMLHRQF